MSTSIPDLFAPPDVDAAFDAWGANCGPGALAAALGRPVNSIRAAVVGDAKQFRGYMAPRDMKLALAAMQVPMERHGKGEGIALRPLQPTCVELAWIQWRGPWDGIPRVAAVYSHWIAHRTLWLGDNRPTGWIYDVTAQQHEWLTRASWDLNVVPNLIPKRGTGSWHVAWCCDIDLTKVPDHS